MPTAQEQKLTAMRQGRQLRGCGVGCLLVALVFVVSFFAAWRFVRRHYAGAVVRLREQGYETIQGQFVEINETLTNRTVVFAQTVRVAKGSEGGIAIVAQSAKIAGTVKGNIYFFGQILVVEPGAELVRNLHVLAQRVELEGRLQGELRGYYVELIRTPTLHDKP